MHEQFNDILVANVKQLVIKYFEGTSLKQGKKVLHTWLFTVKTGQDTPKCEGQIGIRDLCACCSAEGQNAEEHRCFTEILKLPRTTTNDVILTKLRRPPRWSVVVLQA